MLTGAYVSLSDLISLSSTASVRESRRKTPGSVYGNSVSRHRGRGIDFDEVRLYQPGDDVRNIDWNVTARKRVPHTKVFTEERERPTLLLVDQTMTMFLGSKHRLKSVAAAEIAARIAWKTLAQKDRVGGLVFGLDGIETIKPFRSGKAVVRMLRAIVNANTNLNSDHDTASLRQFKQGLWESILERLQRVAPSHHRIVVVSDLNAVDERTLNELLSRGRRNDLQVFHVFDEIEQTLPPSNFYSVSNGVAQLSFNSARRSLREEYSQRFSQRVEELRSVCLRHGVQFSSISTDIDLDSISFAP